MGKQSSRLIYQGKDHKEIICMDKFYGYYFHDKLYKGNLLVWEKIYPEKCFVFIDDLFDQTSILFFLDGYVEKKMVSYGRIDGIILWHIESYGKSLAVCDTNYLSNGILKGGMCVTRNFKKFKKFSEFSALSHTAVGNSVLEYSLNSNVEKTLFIFDENMEYEVKKINTSGYSIICGYYSNGNRESTEYHKGDFFGFWKSSTDSSDKSTIINYLLIDEYGNERKFMDKIPNVTDNLSYNELTDRTLNGAVARIVLGKYLFYIQNANRYYDREEKKWTRYSHTKIMRRDLENFSLEMVADLGEYYADGSANGIYFHETFPNSRLLYASFSKYVFLAKVKELSGTSEYLYFFEMNVDGNVKFKNISDKILLINVYGENNRKITVKFEAETEQEYNEDIIYINSCNIQSYVGVPSINNGEIELDVMGGMLIGFTYLTPKFQMYGFMYINNFYFQYSENNYIYIVNMQYF